jgi:ADP-ribosylglycohydrolase
MPMTKTMILEEQVVRSALWAAFGDAVGFPTELVSRHEFTKRNGRSMVDGPIDWSRRVGGLFGPTVPFPVGTYSDDTQLRLCTSRAIRGDGFFDVESFAKIELPVWLNYALGAGRGSKAAASNLSLRESTWSQNFYQTGENRYWNGGGNGAAMRIQPHVWQAHSGKPESFMRDVVRNSICTHGHPRAVIGAAIHAQFLYDALSSRSITAPEKWAELGESAAITAYQTLVEDPELSLVWIPNWENFSKKSLKDEWAKTVLEWNDCVETTQSLFALGKEPTETYCDILNELGGFTAEERGSGLKTTLFATVLAWLFKDDRPEAGILVSANTFKSDTDTIGTMVGALVGAITDEYPRYEIQDAEYIIEEAQRIYRMRNGKQKSFRYPDLLTWTPPKNQSDAWRETTEFPVLAGLGKLSLLGSPFFSTKGNETMWQWCTLPFGQTVLAKRRANSRVEKAPESSSLKSDSPQKRITAKPLEVDHAEVGLPQLVDQMSIKEYAQLCIRSDFDAKKIGEGLLFFASGDHGVENAVGFAAIIAMARMSRNR